MAVVHDDTFAKASAGDTALPSWTPDTIGTGYTMVTDNSTGAVSVIGSSAGYAQHVNENSRGETIRVQDPTATNEYDVEITWSGTDQVGDDTCGAIGRLTDASNWYNFWMDNGSTCRIRKGDGGVFTTLTNQGHSGDPPTNGDVFTFQMRTGEKTVQRDSGAGDVEWGTTTDNAVTGTGYGGIQIGSGGSVNYTDDALDDIHSNWQFDRLRIVEFGAGGANPHGPLGHPLHGPFGGPV